MSHLPEPVLQHLDRVSRSQIVLRANNALDDLREAGGDPVKARAAAKRIGEVAGVPEQGTGLTVLRESDRKLEERAVKRALKGAPFKADSDDGATLIDAVREGYDDGATNPLSLIVAELPASEAELRLRIEDGVDQELVRRLVRRQADEFEAEQASEGKPPMDIGPLSSLLERDDAPRWCIRDVLPAEGRVTLVAPNKTGKTTMVGDLIRSLVTGEPFLGRFEVEPFTGNVLLLNYEISAATQGRWLADQGLSKKQARRVHVANLRGTENPLSSDRGREQLAEYMREHDVRFLIVDPWGRAYTGDQDSNSAVGPWLTMLDKVATDGGAREVMLTVHAGWANGDRTAKVRARGASALADWPDAIWRLSRDDSDDARYFEAEGRDVLVEQDRLEFDAESRRLTMTGEGGKQAARAARKAADLAQPVLDVVRRIPGVPAGEISKALRRDGVAFNNGDESRAITALVRDGLLLRYKAGRIAHHYLPKDAPPGVGPTTL